MSVGYEKRQLRLQFVSPSLKQFSYGLSYQPSDRNIVLFGEGEDVGVHLLVQ
jgi:hypothetical protein